MYNKNEQIITTEKKKSKQREHVIASRGRLKIFLGYCAGVGKTYKMLQEGIVGKKQSVEVLVGFVETHGRVETEALVHELEVLPRKKTNYSGICIEEMDLDKILELCPQLVLVDELAHTNIPGSRHTKRYQDVEELLNAGISVYTTLNIQHIQSQVDIVQQITGVRVDEIIPDSIFDVPAEIELVDLSPEKLQQRLVEGKVYIPQKAKIAMHSFFKKGNLLALRELSLKYTAKQVDTELLSYREQEEISEIWPIESKILVGISYSRNTEKVLLAAHRMASDLAAEWYAVHVESPQQVVFTAKERNQLYRNINLAEELGAKVVTLSGIDIALELVKFAKKKNVTLIIASLSQHSRFKEIFQGAVLNKIVKIATPINVLVVGGKQKFLSLPKSKNKKRMNIFPYFLGMIGVMAIFGLSWLFPGVILAHNPLMTLLLPVVMAGVLGGVSVGVSTAFFSLLPYILFYVPPLNSFAIGEVSYVINILFFMVMVLGVSLVGRKIRWSADSARHRERFVYALYNFSREIIGAESFDDILVRAMNSIADAFESDVMIFLLNQENGQLNLMVKTNAEIQPQEAEQAVALWVCKNGRHAGKGTRTLSSSKWYYVPLKTREQVLGVICLQQNGLDDLFSPEQRRLLEAFAGVVALALDKHNKHSDLH